MVGIINDNVPPVGQSQAGQNQQGVQAAAKSMGDKIDPQVIRAQIKVPPQFEEAYKRVVVAGGKFMFDPRTHEQAIKGLEGDGPIGDRLGKAIAGLMALLFKQSNNTMPPQVVIPAGVDLLTQAAAFIQESKLEPMTVNDLSRALVVMMSEITRLFGGDGAKVENAMSGGGVPDAQQAADEGQEGPAHEAAPGDANEDSAEGEPPDEEQMKQGA